MGVLNTYNFKDVDVIFGGLRLQGYGEGDAVAVARDEDSFTKQIGADGEVTRSKTNNRSGSIEVTVQQGSQVNAQLQALLNADERTGQGIAPIAVVDRSGSYLANGESAWLRKPADNGFGRDTGERTWIFDVAQLGKVGGGN